MSEGTIMDPVEFREGYPVRQEICVLPADDPKKLHLDFFVKEYHGIEAWDLSGHFRAGGKIGDVSLIPEDGWNPNWFIHGEVKGGIEIGYHSPDGDGSVVIPVSKRADISIGDWFVVQGIIGFSVAKVTCVDGNKADVDDGGCLWPMEFGKDDRKCWVCTGQINKMALFDPECKAKIDIPEKGP